MKMRLLLAFVLLVAVLTTVTAFPSTKNGPPFQVDEDIVDPRDPPKQEQQEEEGSLIHHRGRGKRALEMDEKFPGNDVDDMVVMKRRPYNNAAWPKSGSTVEIPYTTSGVNNEVLTRAIEVFNAKTCVRFVPRNGESNFVLFRSGRSCNAMVGYQNVGQQTCDVTSGCAANKGKVLHEMMHILSFLHEQCRSDRDSYVTVHTDRILSAALPNFNIISESVDQGIPYDCDSILHYKSTAFAATSGQETITSSHCSHLGNGDTRLSLLDYKRVNTLYNCNMPTYMYYNVRVVTSSSLWSGTDCFIYLTLHGSSHTSTEFELDLSTDPSANLFETGSDDTFNYMAYRNDLGSITGISLRMVDNGSGPSWKPTSFTVTDPNTSTSVTFTNNQWLYPSSTYGTSNFPIQ